MSFSVPTNLVTVMDYSLPAPGAEEVATISVATSPEATTAAAASFDPLGTDTEETSRDEEPSLLGGMTGLFGGMGGGTPLPKG